MDLGLDSSASDDSLFGDDDSDDEAETKQSDEVREETPNKGVVDGAAAKKSEEVKEETTNKGVDEPATRPARRIVKARRPQRTANTPTIASETAPAKQEKNDRAYDCTKEAKGDWEAVTVTIEGDTTQQTEEEFYQVVLQMKAHYERHLKPDAKNSRPHLARMTDAEYKTLLQQSYLDYAVQFLVAWNLLGPAAGERIIPRYAELFVDNGEPHRTIRRNWLDKYVLGAPDKDGAIKRFAPMQLFNALTTYPPANTKEAWEKIMKHPDCCWLRGIFLQDSWWGDPLVSNIVHATQFNDKLVKLDLQSNKITDAGAKLLAGCKNFRQLTHLSLFRNWIEEVPGVTLVAVSTSSVNGDFVHRSTKTSGEGGGLTALLQAGDNFPRLRMLSIGYQSGCPMSAYIQSLESTVQNVFPELTSLMIQCTVYESEGEYGWEPYIDSTFSHLKSGGKFPKLQAIHLQQCCNGHGEVDDRQSADGVKIHL